LPCRELAGTGIVAIVHDISHRIHARSLRTRLSRRIVEAALGTGRDLLRRSVRDIVAVRAPIIAVPERMQEAQVVSKFMCKCYALTIICPTIMRIGRIGQGGREGLVVQIDGIPHTSLRDFVWQIIHPAEEG
jgi:hypothetical protein